MKENEPIIQDNQEELLKNAEIQDKRVISEKGINEVYYVSFAGGEAGIFKPKSGEKQIPKMEEIFPAGTYYKRERAAYLVDKALGFGVVPPTEIRMIDGEEGSVQKFIKDATPLNLIPKEEKDRPEMQRQLIRAWILDYIINQSDSAEENFLVSDGKLSAIDNGLSFEKTITDFDYENFWQQPIPEDLRQSIKSFFASGKFEDELKGFLSELLSEGEVNSCLARARKVADFIG